MEKQTLKQLRKGDYFRTIDKGGNVSAETYIKDDYCREAKKYFALKCSDVWGSAKLMRPDQQITTEFIY